MSLPASSVPEIPGYEIRDTLGVGGASTVYRALELASGEEVAVKVYHRHQVIKPEFPRRFQREVTIATALSDPGVVRVRSCIDDPARLLHVLVMDLVPGTSLRTLIGRRSITAATALKLTMEMAQILVRIHQKGVAHLDLKPENVLFNPAGEIRLTDFGVSQGIHGEMMQEGLKTQTVSGTIYYIAPEMFVPGGRFDHRADIYALGIMLHEMITGERPYGACQPLDRWVPARYCAEVLAFIEKLMHKDPGARYQTCKDVAGKVTTLALYRKALQNEAGTGEAPPGDPPPPAPSPAPLPAPPLAPPAPPASLVAAPASAPARVPEEARPPQEKRQPVVEAPVPGVTKVTSSTSGPIRPTRIYWARVRQVLWESPVAFAVGIGSALLLGWVYLIYAYFVAEISGGP